MTRPAAPPVACDSCSKPIGRTRAHHLLRDGRVACQACVTRHHWWPLVASTATRAGLAKRRGQRPATRPDNDPGTH